MKEKLILKRNLYKQLYTDHFDAAEEWGKTKTPNPTLIVIQMNVELGKYRLYKELYEITTILINEE